MIRLKTIGIYIVFGFITLSSCSALKSSKEDNKDTSIVLTEQKEDISTEVLEDTLSADMSELSVIYYKDNSIHDTIWVQEENILLKSMSNDEYISSIDNTWIDQLQKSGFFYEEQAKHETNVLHVDDSIIKHRLAELNKTTPLDLDYNPIVKSYINTYLYKRANQMERMMGLAEYYYPMFEEVLDRYDIPLELKHLAIVESALNPRAKSPVGASGLWQFMYPTGKQYGLNVSSYVDERRDPYLETVAAARFMRDLYRMFGDWNLVLAAYNSGPGNVKKAIRRSGGHRNFWYIRPYLPRETRGYVPAFIAVNYSMEYGKEHNLKPRTPKISYYKTDTIMVKSKITFDQISNKLDITKEELEFLNPSYRHNIIPHVKNKGYKLVLPIEKVDEFVNNESTIYAYADSLNKVNIATMPKYNETNDMIKYRVRSGDVLGKIADRYGVRVSDIKRWNRLRGNNIRVGQRLTIYPRKMGYTATKSSAKKSTAKSNNKYVDIKGSYSNYTVKSGDNLWLIAKKYPGISANDIQSWNRISNTQSLKPGMTLKIANKG